MSPQGWRSRAALFLRTGLGSRASSLWVFTAPHSRSSQHSSALPAHTHQHPAARWDQSPDSVSHTAPLPTCGCAPSSSSQDKCHSRGLLGVTVTRTPTPVSQSPCRTTVVLHEVRAAAQGVGHLFPRSLTGGQPHLSSALTSARLVFH